jgi:hypothetical protein
MSKSCADRALPPHELIRTFVAMLNRFSFALRSTIVVDRDSVIVVTSAISNFNITVKDFGIS